MEEIKHIFSMLEALPKLCLAGLFALFGVMVGSFLNVVIYRWPKMMELEWRDEVVAFLRERHPELLDISIRTPIENEVSKEVFNLAVPRSRCSSCHHVLSWYENIPIISWCWLKGKCRSCRSAISPRYLLIEALTALTSGWIGYRYGFTPLAGAAFLFNAMLICAFWIDWDTQLLPDDLTIPLVWGGLVSAYLGFGFVPFPDAFWGAIAGYGILWMVFWIFYFIFKKEGMGYGDFKLLSALGAWLGWGALPAILLIASLAGLIYGVVRFLTGWSSPSEQIDTSGNVSTESEAHRWSRPLPFGPFLIMAAWLVWIVLPSNYLFVF